MWRGRNIVDVKVWKLIQNPCFFFSTLIIIYFFVFNAGQCISPAKFHILVRIWQLPLTLQSRWGPLIPPRRGRFPRQSPCQPGHLKKTKNKKWVKERLHKQADYSSCLPFFKAFSMSFSSSRACLFPGSFLRRVRMYFKAFSYSWKLSAGEKRRSSAMRRRKWADQTVTTGWRFSEALFSSNLILQRVREEITLTCSS